MYDIFQNLKIDSTQKLEKIKKNPKNMLVLSTIRRVSQKNKNKCIHYIRSEKIFFFRGPKKSGKSKICKFSTFSKIMKILKIDSVQKLEKIKKNPKNMLVLSNIRRVSQKNKNITINI